MEAPFFLAAGVVIGLNIIVAVADWIKGLIRRRSATQEDSLAEMAERHSDAPWYRTGSDD
jgi:tRNA G37 N-methylase TrmD